jgi:hypothetical protein
MYCGARSGWSYSITVQECLVTASGATRSKDAAPVFEDMMFQATGLNDPNPGG